MKLDILAFAAHPDDVEMTCSGTIMKHIAGGKKAGVVDLTRGELGTRGSAELRDKEAAAASELMKLSVRENLKMPDGFFEATEANKLSIVKMIRKYQPEIVLANAIHDRHPDHGRASKLVSDCCFLSGLAKLQTEEDGKPQPTWRPSSVYHYIQDRYIKPDFIVDISDYMEKRMEVIRCYKSQFYDPDSTEPETMISSKLFFTILENRAAELGRQIGASYGEGFTVERPPGINDFFCLK